MCMEATLQRKWDELEDSLMDHAKAMKSMHKEYLSAMKARTDEYNAVCVKLEQVSLC